MNLYSFGVAASRALNKPSLSTMSAIRLKPSGCTKLLACIALAGLLFPLVGNVPADTINIPNSSFESPTVPPGFPAYPVIDSWQKTPDPGIPLPMGFTWDQTAGVFPNTTPFIDNADGNQLAYLLNIPGVGISQDLSAMFGVGNSYKFTLGLTGGGGMPDGSSLLLGLYYRDGANAMVPVGMTSVTYSAAAFPNNTTHLYDYSVNVPSVLAGDAWAGKNIGVEVLLTGGNGNGYWDADNARLVVVPEPASLGILAVLGAGVVFLRRRQKT